MNKHRINNSRINLWAAKGDKNSLRATLDTITTIYKQITLERNDG